MSDYNLTSLARALSQPQIDLSDGVTEAVPPRNPLQLSRRKRLSSCTSLETLDVLPSPTAAEARVLVINTGGTIGMTLHDNGEWTAIARAHPSRRRHVVGHVVDMGRSKEAAWQQRARLKNSPLCSLAQMALIDKVTSFWTLVSSPLMKQGRHTLSATGTCVNMTEMPRCPTASVPPPFQNTCFNPPSPKVNKGRSEAFLERLGAPAGQTDPSHPLKYSWGRFLKPYRDPRTGWHPLNPFSLHISAFLKRFLLNLTVKNKWYKGYTISQKCKQYQHVKMI